MEFIWLSVQIQTAPIHKTELLRCQQLFRISSPALISSILVIFCHGKLVNKHNEEKTQTQCKYFWYVVWRLASWGPYAEFAVNGKLPADWLSGGLIELPVHLLPCLYAPAADLACIARVLILVMRILIHPARTVCLLDTGLFSVSSFQLSAKSFQSTFFHTPRLSNRLERSPSPTLERRRLPG